MIVVGAVAAAGLWAFVYRTQFGVVLRATSQNMRMASALGVNVNRVYVQAFTLGCFMAGLGGAIVVPQQGAVLGMGVDALILAFVVVVIGGLGSLEGALVGALIVGVVREFGITFFPEVELAVLYLMAASCCSSGRPGSSAAHERRSASPRRVLICGRARRRRARDPAARWCAPYQTVLLSYGLIFAIAALGFNLLLGLHGPPLVRALRLLRGGRLRGGLHREVPEDRLDGGVPRSAASSARPLVAALFGLLCVRYTRIFFGILTLALSQVLWSLAFKFFWVTGGHRRPAGADADPARRRSDRRHRRRGQDRLSRPPVLLLRAGRSSSSACAVMWVIVHSPFGKALQAIRDNETRAEFVGVQVWHYRWVAFLVSGIYTGLAGALWVPLNGLTTPDILHWTFSGKIVFFTVLGRLSDVRRARSSARWSTTTSRPTPSATPCTGRWCSGRAGRCWSSRCRRASWARRCRLVPRCRKAPAS